MSNEIVRLLLLLRPQVLVMAGITVVAYLVMLAAVSRLKVTGRGYRMPALFVGLGFQSTLHLSIAWVKLLFAVTTLLLAKNITGLHYLLLAGLTVVACLVNLNWRSLLLELFGGVFTGVGFWLCAKLLEYLRQVRFDGSVNIIRWALCVLLVLCTAAIFLKEISFISGERKHFDENGEVE